MRLWPSPYRIRPDSLPRGWRCALSELPAAVSAVFAVRVLLALSSLHQVRRNLLPRHRADRPADLVEIARIAWAVRVASWVVPFASCLTRAQTGQVLLARRGVASTLILGIGPAGGDRMAAHAWLVCSGRVVLGAETEAVAAFRPIAELGSVA
jgi:hypothetical protein